MKPLHKAYIGDKHQYCEVVSLFFLLAIVIGLLYILTRIAQYFRRHRATFPHASYVLWRRSYHMFIIISLATLGYVLISLQLLNHYR